MGVGFDIDGISGMVYEFLDNFCAYRLTSKNLNCVMCVGLDDALISGKISLGIASTLE